MKTFSLLQLLSGLVISTLLIIGTQQNQPNAGKDSSYEYLEQQLANAKGFTIDVFEAMPADEYGFKPTEDVRTFGAQAYHIAYSIEWFHAQLKGEPIAWNPGDENSMTKEELLTYFEEQFDSMTTTILEADESGPFTVGVMGVLQHNAHHRGQMVTYLRANGVEAPGYR